LIVSALSASPAGNMLFATRLWWALRRYGFPEEDIAILDG
jgi:3-mercaptopyruvate sulfurtransferase SseA